MNISQLNIIRGESDSLMVLRRKPTEVPNLIKKLNKLGISGLNPEINEVMKELRFPSYFDLIVAICAGIAVGFSITGTIRSAFVGVAIAAALLVPSVNIGLAFALGNMDLAIKSFVLFIVNIIAINLCAIGVFKVKKVRPLPPSVPVWIRRKREKNKDLHNE